MKLAQLKRNLDKGSQELNASGFFIFFKKVSSLFNDSDS